MLVVGAGGGNEVRAYRIARAVRINEGGSLTFVSGFLSSRPGATSVLQGAINAALEALARGLALETAPVRVNAVSLGMIDTPLWSRMGRADRKHLFTRAIVFVATHPFNTGSTVTIDGGGTIA